MGDLKERFDALSKTSAPDLWDDIEERESRGPSAPAPSAARRAAIAALALTLAGAAIGFTLRAFSGSPTPAVSPEPSLPANGDIFFSIGGAEVGIAWQAVSPDGSDRRTLIPRNSEVHYDQVAWSPDGRRIAFVDYLVGHYGIYTADPDGSHIERLTNGINDARPSWSPDGRMIAFSSTRADPSVGQCEPGDFGSGGLDCPSDIYVMNADGSGVRRLGADARPEWGPVWSPDGSQIAFTRQDVGTRTDVVLMNADGSDGRVVSSTPEGSNLRPSWSPDGSSLAYVSIRNEDWGIYVTDLMTGQERELVTNSSSVDDPVWSPDGQRIAFVSAYVDLMIMNADGSDVRAIAHDPNNVGIDDITWRPHSATEPAVVKGELAIDSQTIDTGLRFPEGVVVGESAVWVAAGSGDAAGGDLIRLDPRTGDIDARIAMPSLPGWEFGGAGIATGQGSVWVAAGGTGGGTVLYRVDPQTNAIAETIHVGEGNAADVWVDDSGIWVLAFPQGGGSMNLYGIDPATHDVAGVVEVPATWSQNVFVAGGWVYVLGNTDDRNGAPAETLFQIDPESLDIIAQFQPADGAALFMSASSDRLWFFHGGLRALDATTGAELIGPLDAPERCCSGLIADGDGGVWVVSASGRADETGVWHVDRDGHIDASTSSDPGEDAEGVAGAYDPATQSLWIADSEDTVLRLGVR